MTLRPATLRSIREELGLTQVELAARLGRNRTTIAKWEAGMEDIPARPELRLALAALLAGIRPVE